MKNKMKKLILVKKTKPQLVLKKKPATKTTKIIITPTNIFFITHRMNKTKLWKKIIFNFFFKMMWDHACIIF